MSSSKITHNMSDDLLNIGSWTTENINISPSSTAVHDPDDIVLQSHPEIATTDMNTATILETYLPTMNKKPNNASLHCVTATREENSLYSSAKTTTGTSIGLAGSVTSHTGVADHSITGGEETGVQPRDGG